MRKDLIAKAYHLAQSLPDARVDMDAWVKEGGCGTVACMAGHMTADGIFRAEGLNLEREGRHLTPTFYWKKTDKNWLGMKRTKEIKCTGFNALAAILDISTTDAYNLFGKVNVQRGSHREAFMQRVEGFAKKHDIPLDPESGLATNITASLTERLTTHEQGARTDSPAATRRVSV